MEAVLHKLGDDFRASQVYLERRRVERKRMFSERRFARWVSDLFYKTIANYGIRPYRLFAYATFFVLLGTLLFSRPSALEPKDEKKSVSATTDSVLSGSNWETALGVSVHQFLPIDVPVGSSWVPVSRKITIPVRIAKRTLWISAWPSVYATVFLRLTGAILVGIGLASIAGLLRRVTP